MAYPCTEEKEGNDDITRFVYSFPSFYSRGMFVSKIYKIFNILSERVKRTQWASFAKHSAQRLYFRPACSIKEPPCTYCPSSRCEHLGIAQPQSFHRQPLRLFTIPWMTYCYYHLSIEVDYIQVKSKLSGH